MYNKRKPRAPKILHLTKKNTEKKKQTGGLKNEAEIPNPPIQPAPVVSPGKPSKQIGSPIISITPL